MGEGGGAGTHKQIHICALYIPSGHMPLPLCLPPIPHLSFLGQRYGSYDLNPGVLPLLPLSFFNVIIVKFVRFRMVCRNVKVNLDFKMCNFSSF